MTGFGSWIMRIARTKLIDYYRSNSRRPHAVSIEADPASERTDPLQIRDMSPDPAEVANSGQLRQLVFQEIGKLREKYRVVLYFRLIGDEQVDDIATRLGIRESAVRMRLLRGLKMLRKGLQKYGVSGQA